MQKNICKFLILLIFTILFFTVVPVDKTLSGDINNNGDKEYTEINNFYTCEITGIIDPPISNYVIKCLKKSLDSGYGLIILMNTPGGLETSMK